MQETKDTRPRVLITGASRGIGKALAKRLSQEYRLILHASTLDGLKGTLAELQGEGHECLPANFANDEEFSQFLKTLKANYSDDLYGVINNAGLTLDKALLFQPERDIDLMLQVNLKVPILITKTALKIFNKTKRGTIIQMSSVVGQTGNAFQSIYGATKAGLINFTKSMAKEVAALNHNEKHNIRLLTIAPGFIQTEMTNKIPAADLANYLKQIPSQRLGTVEEVGELVSFLLSDKAAYMNGTTINIDGGMVC
jgi:3-oxoacyl-[acyl-carrier protein] reductase